MIKLGYFKDSNDIDLEGDATIAGLTNINWCFLKVKNQMGELTHDFQNAHKIKEIKKKHPHITVSLAIGGWGAGNFSESVETAQKREMFSNDAIKYLKEYDADGIDLDWEYPCVSSGIISAHPKDKENFVLLLEKLREDLDKLGNENNKKYILSVAVGANVSSQVGIDFPKLNKLVDLLNVMTYDMGGTFTTTGHQTSLYPSSLTDQLGGAEVVDRILKTGFAKEKIVYGCAFYGRGGSGVVPLDKNKTGICSRYYGEQGSYYDYHEIVEQLKEGKLKEYIDEEAVAVYAFDGDKFITYDTPWTVSKKVEYVKEKGLGGIMYWEHQTDKTRTLIKEIIKE